MTPIVVTGMAWRTALGSTLDGVWQRLVNGESGIAPLASRHALKNERVAAIPDIDRDDIAATLHDLTKQTVAAAIDDAHLPVPLHRQRTVLVVGTSFGARLDDSQCVTQPLDRWVQDVADEFGVTSIALSTACSSGSDALLVGAELIDAGMADCCICGGADVLSNAKRLAHTALGTMSSTTLRSFDEHRDGTILGEGVGFLVLERADKRADVQPYALLRGAGSSNDAAGLTAPDRDGNGIRLAVNRSLAAAGLRPDDIGVINAHGSGTPTNDRIESAAYGRLFGASCPTVFATKGAFGHTLGATGALEAIALILALQRRSVPPIYALGTPIHDFDLPMPIAAPASIDARYGLSVTIGFGGFNTSLVFERSDA